MKFILQYHALQYLFPRKKSLEGSPRGHKLEVNYWRSDEEKSWEGFVPVENPDLDIVRLTGKNSCGENPL